MAQPDIQAALKAGYTLDQINDFLGQQAGADIAGARNAGYSEDQILTGLGYSAKPDDTGDFMRGAKVALGQTGPILKGVAGLAGATAEKVVGEGGMATSLKNWGLKGYQEGMQKLAPLQHKTDDLTTAWDKAKEGDYGALVDWAQYGLGYAVGQVGESAAAMLLGAGAGAALAPEAAPVSAGTGAVSGLVARGAVMGTAANLVEKAVAKQAAEIAAEQALKTGAKLTGEELAAKAASQEVRNLATKAVAKEIGATTGAMAYGTAQELGTIYPTAEEEAGKQGRKLTGGDLARVWGTGLAAGGLEGLTDKLGIDVAMGKLPLPGGRITRGVTGALGGAAVEGGTEAAQTALERIGADQSLTDQDAIKDYVNSAGLGAIGGAAMGGGGGLISRHRQNAVDILAEQQRQFEADQRKQQATVDMAHATNVDEAIVGADALAGTVDEHLSAAATVNTPDLAAQHLQSMANPAQTSDVDQAIATAASQAEPAPSLELPQMQAPVDETTSRLEAAAAQSTPATDEISDRLQAASETPAATETPASIISSEPGSTPLAPAPQVDATKLATERATGARNALVNRISRAIEDRDGVATTAEADFLQRAGLGRLHDRIDDSVVPVHTPAEQALAEPALAPRTEQSQQAAQVEQQTTPAAPQAQSQALPERTEIPTATPVPAGESVQTGQSQEATQEAVQATQPATPAQTTPAPAAPSQQPTVATQAMSALITPVAQRTVEQRQAIETARQELHPDDFKAVELAATAPMQLTSEQRARVTELRTPPAEASTLEQAAEAGRKPTIQTLQAESAQPKVPGATLTVTDNDTEHQVNIVDPSRLGVQGRVITQIARVFGKRVVAFESPTLAADGFVTADDNQTLHLNVDSQMSPLAVAGHELTHLFKRDNPFAYQALENVVRRTVTAEGQQAFGKKYGQGASLEELTSDLVGNRFQEPQFWQDVFAEIEKNAPKNEARSSIQRLSAAVMKAIDAILKVIRQKGFNADAYVSDLEAVRSAAKSAFAQYAQEQRIPAMRAEMELARAQSQISLASAAGAPSAAASAPSHAPVAGVAAPAAGAIPITTSDQLSRKREQIGDHLVSPAKDGSLTVFGDPAAIRALLPEGVVGRPAQNGLVFTHSAAPRVRAALEGNKIAYSRAGQVIDRLPVKDGKYVGAPEKFNTPGKIPTLRRWLRQLALEGAPGRYWYENSSREVLKMVGGNVQEARRFVALLAIYSPQAKVDANSTFALRAWAQYKAVEPINVKTGSQDGKAQAAMADVDAFWSGEKTGNFFFNLLREIDPSTAGKQGATIDMWMMRAGQYTNDAPTATQYAFMENETNRLAAELGWEPQQVQAAIWVAMKARMENTGVKKATEASSQKKGWLTYEYPEKNGRPVKTRKILDEQAHRNNWLKHAFEHNPSEQDTAQAKFDFGDGLRRHIGQISFEARPSRVTGVLPGIHNAPYAQQVEFQQDVQKAFYDDNGVDLLAQKLGLLVDTASAISPGVWKQEVSPSNQMKVAMAPSKGEAGKTSVDPAQGKLLSVYAAVAGLVTKQDGVGWHRPFYTATRAQANGVAINLGRAITPDQAKALSQAINTWMVENDRQGWEDSFAIISSGEGVRLVSFGAVENSELHKEIVRVAESVLPDFSYQLFASSGEMPSNDWESNPNGQSYVQRIRAEGRSDVLEWARDFLAPRVQRVFDEYSQRYNWGDPGTAQFSRKRGGRDQSGEVAPLAGAPTVAGATGPDARLVRVAEQYARENGLPFQRQAEYAKVDEDRARRIAAAYDSMPHAPQDPRVQEAYENLIRQTVDQYHALERAGYRFYLFDDSNDPYGGNPWNAMRDLRANQVMGVYATEAGFGSGATNLDVKDNPLLADTGIKWPYGSLDGKPKRVLANDLFRAVHDAFGHGLEGAGFRADGEENAWQAHSQLFTGSALGAITSETRGQNSWLNYGPHGEKNRSAKVEDTTFADQKTGLMPEWTWTEGRLGAEQPAAEPEAEAPKPAKRSVDMVPREELAGRRLNLPVRVEETGETATINLDAKDALDDVDLRENAMQRFLECLTT